MLTTAFWRKAVWLRSKQCLIQPILLSIVSISGCHSGSALPTRTIKRNVDQESPRLIYSCTPMVDLVWGYLSSRQFSKIMFKN